MKKFKLHQGTEKSFLISKENFEAKTIGKNPCVLKNDDEEKRCFPICQACDNPIQLIDVYKELKNADPSYGKSTNLADYNHRSYLFCPCSSQSKSVTKNINERKATDYEKKIYDAVRDYFDLAIYIIEQDTGIHITKRMAEMILDEYIASRGYMYYWATPYNIPWMLLYFTRPFSCFRTTIRKNTCLWKFFDQRDDVTL